MTIMGLNPQQVQDMINQAKAENETVVVRCIRKGPASKTGGPDQGEPYDLVVAPKPLYKAKNPPSIRKAEDKKHGVLTVFTVNRQDPKTKQWGCWRRVNIQQVLKVIFKGKEWAVIQP